MDNDLIDERHEKVKEIREMVLKQGILPTLGMGSAEIVGMGAVIPHTKEEFEKMKWDLKCCGCPESKLEEHTSNHFRISLLKCRFCGAIFDGIKEEEGLSITCSNCTKMMRDAKKRGKKVVGEERPYTIGVQSEEVEKRRFRFGNLLFNKKSWLLDTGEVVTVVPDGGMIGTAHWAVISFEKGYPLEVGYW